MEVVSSSSASSSSGASMTRAKTSMQVRAEAYVKKLGYRLPSQDEIVTEIGFTPEELALREHSIATTMNADEFQHIDEEYCMEHLTERGEATIRKFYTALEARVELRGLIRILTKTEVLANAEPLIIAGPLGSSDKFKQAPANKLFLFANQEGIVYLHMRVSSVIGNVWKSYYFKSERMNNLQSFCFIVMDMHIAELKSLQDKKEADQRMIELNRREEELMQQAEKDKHEKELALKSAENALKSAEDALKSAEEANKRAEEAEKLAENERKNREAIEKKTAQIRGITKEKLTINFIEYFYLVTTVTLLRQSYVKPGRTSELRNRLSNYDTGSSEKHFYIDICRASNAQEIENSVASKFGPFKKIDNCELLLCNIPELKAYVRECAASEDRRVKIANEHNNNFVDHGIYDIDRIKLYPPIDIAAYIAENPIVKNAKLGRRSIGKGQTKVKAEPEKPLDKMSDAEFENRMFEIIDDEVFKQTNQHISDLSDGITVSTTWKMLKIPIKKEISSDVSIIRIRPKVQSIFKDNRLSKIKCTFFERIRK